MTATNFAATSAVTLTFDGIAITPASCSVKTSLVGAVITTTAAGAFTCAFNIPFAATAGTGTLVASDPTGPTTATATDTVTAWTLTLSATTGSHSATHTITITGAGFAATSKVSITFNGTVVIPASCSTGVLYGANINTSAAGAFACSYTVPIGAAGVYAFTASERDELSDRYRILHSDLVHGQGFRTEWRLGHRAAPEPRICVDSSRRRDP